ncbi:DUF1028 domain-containing protein [Cryptosporangium phraense]|uniref:DUF1028 domain-containing protein n=1 Tax=Cryptosporangium phraense TaxID=2593070 RepID=A0A545AYS4_9ACTN|nr:DUF1028 domain-containing protein [Cryptosporangium phraense]TQS46444.1 DUF1028 domain-containing protein [Cryptosporangium phraense]
MTFSVLGRDPVTGELGVGVASCVLAVGRAVPWGRAGVGVVVTQSQPRRGYGPHALAGLEAGVPVRTVLSTLLGRDSGAAGRQVAVLAGDGSVAVHTGDDCLATAGDRYGDGWSVQGNLLRSPGVLDAMADAWVRSAAPVAERLLTVLEAGEAAGGDLRGRQSASLLVVGGRRVAEPWDAVTVDLRVDHAENPLAQLRQLLAMQRAYEDGDSAALAELAPDSTRAVHAALDAARRGDLDGARAALAELRRNPEWERWLRSGAMAGRFPHLTQLLD